MQDAPVLFGELLAGDAIADADAHAAVRRGEQIGELAELVLLNGPALTKNTDKLVSLGVVQRAADPLDNRKVLLLITDLGLEVVARLGARVDAHHDSIEEALGTRKTQQLKRLLESFIAGVGERRLRL